MTTTHVFIVDVTTFKCHLEYLFAGTGAKDHKVDFNDSKKSSLHYAVENMLTGMIADSQRVRKGDFVIFYLQQNVAEEIYEGKFYGIFKVKEAPSFLDNNDSHQFLKNELNKSLTFRTLLEPFQVYPKGVTEWEALDEIKNLQSPNQMLWSLIYRKLKGNRGNTMITLYESERLFKQIRDKNNRSYLTSPCFTFNESTQEIISLTKPKAYLGRNEAINILPRLIQKFTDNKAFESNLQAYIVQNIGRNTNLSLDHILIADWSIEWLGNEVSCGVGMQRIDVLLSLVKGNDRHCVPIELKAIEANSDITYQVQRCVDWIEQYYLPNRISDIQPVIIARIISNKKGDSYKTLCTALKEFNNRNQRCLTLKYIEFDVDDNALEFKEINYL
jgi:predicted RNA-binding protein